MDGDDGLVWVFCIINGRLAAGIQGEVGRQSRYQRSHSGCTGHGRRRTRQDRAGQGTTRHDKGRGALWA